MSAAREDLPDLLYSDAERALADSLTSLLADRGGLDKTVARTESAETYDDALWHAVAAELGCAGLLIPERDGGAGASYREAASAAEALGAAVAPVPFLGSAVVATAALLRVASTAPSRAAADLLRRMADGGVTTALVTSFATPPGRPFPVSVRVAGSRPGDGAAGVARLRGLVSGVTDALPAGVPLVPADGVPHGLYLVDVSRPGRGQGARGITGHEQAAVRPVVRRRPGHADRLWPGGVPGAGGGADRRRGHPGRRAGRGGPALPGHDGRLYQGTAPVRPAGRVVPGPQAPDGRRLGRGQPGPRGVQVRGGLPGRGPLDPVADPEAKVAVAMAKAYCSEAAVLAAQECVQLHGGIGFTWEHPAHLYLKRAKADSIGFGTPDAHRAALAALVNLPAS